jgi:hypothetical protein
VLALLAPLAAAGDAPASSPFSAEAYIAHVKTLASDEFGGRGPGQPGIEMAAEYIAKHFESAGLKPAGVDGGWYQPFTIDSGFAIGRDLVEADASLEVAGAERSFALNKDWVSMPYSAPDTVEGPLAFAGFGIEAKDFMYDDFAGFDAKGKVLLIFRYEPRAEDPEAKFGGEQPSEHALFARKAEIAREKGALALIIVNPPERKDQSDDALMPYDYWRSQRDYRIPMVQMTQAAASALLAKANMPPLRELQHSIEKERKPLSKDMGMTVKLNPGLKKRVIETRNVLGLLPGSERPHEYLVIGAHYDHLGTRPRGTGTDTTPVVYNGADDNASGTSGILELARVLASGQRPKRSILFIAFTAEEMGLLGSRHYVDHPLIPLEQTVAMINLDMIGRFVPERFMIYGVPTAKEFADITERAAKQADVPYVVAQALPGNSDHASFQRHKIPVIFPFTNVHAQYHQPEDDWELISGEGAAKVMHMTLLIVREVANLDSGPTWTDADLPSREDVFSRTRSTDTQPTTQAAEDRPRMPGVRLGVMPDYGDGKEGLLVQSVLPGGAAATAGMKDGDRIVEIGGKKIIDIEGYMETLGKFKVGDTTEVVVQRGEETVKLNVQFEAQGRRSSEN